MSKKKRKVQKRRRVDESREGVRIGEGPRRVDKEWSRMTRVNVEADDWVMFRRLCRDRGQAVSDGLGELVRREVQAARRGVERFPR